MNVKKRKSEDDRYEKLKQDIKIQAARELDIMSLHVDSLNFISKLVNDPSLELPATLLSEALRIIKRSSTMFTGKASKKGQTSYEPKKYLQGIIQGSTDPLDLETFCEARNDMNWIFKTSDNIFS
jgi:FKBP-type peptidyl-prolyl cis-trans isomerase (trigger factor)